jgi:pterin-4a-carbinolamine dehydratase
MARLSDEEIEERRSALQGWERDGDAIQRTFELEDSEGGLTELAGRIDRLA